MTDAADLAPPRLRRHRAEKAALAVLPSCAGVWTAAEILHACSASPLGVGAAGLGSAALAGATGHRATATGLLIAGAWTAAAAKLGPLAGPWCPLTDAAAVLSFCGWRWARSHPKVAEARDRRLNREDWLAKRRSWGLDGTHLLEQEETRLGERYLIDTRGSGKRASAIERSGDIAELIAESFPAPLPAGRVRVRAHRLSGRVEISIRHLDPWEHPIPHPLLADDPEIDLSGPCTCRKPFVIGQDPETGRPLTLTVWDEDGGKRILIVATSRAGKTVLLNCLRERATAARDVLVVDLNLSKALEDKEWAPACHLTALTSTQLSRAMKILRILVAIIEWRSQQPRETAVFQPSPEHPLILLTADEIDALARYPAARELLRYIFSKGGSEGVTPVVAGQRGTADWIGGGDIRALIDVFLLGMVGRRAEAMHAAGDLGLEMPDMSKYGEGRKGVWAEAELGGEIWTGRTFLLKEPGDLRTLAEARAMSQPDLEPELQAFLGKPYEELLRTDVFARWAVGQSGPAPAVARPRPDVDGDGFPDGLDPHDPLHALAVLVRDGVVESGDDETTDALMAALDVHEAEQASVAAWDQELNAVVPDDLRSRWLKQGERLEEIRQDLEETAKMDIPDISHEDQVAYAEAQWRQIGEKTVIPDDHRTRLLALLTVKISATEAAQALGVTPWIARTYLARLRLDGLARAVGKGRGAGWILVAQPEGGDGS